MNNLTRMEGSLRMMKKKNIVLLKLNLMSHNSRRNNILTNNMRPFKSRMILLTKCKKNKINNEPIDLFLIS